MNALAPQASSRSRMQVFEGLQKELPCNELGLPKFLYRADLIPEDLYDLPPNEKTAILNSAVIAISYREGYPTFLDGQPIWEQLETEADGDFGLFQLYLGLDAKMGYRQIAAMPDEIGIRFPNLQAANQNEVRGWLKRITEMAAINFWFSRAKAFDLFRTAMARKTRERRALDMENYHFIEADNLLKKLMGASGDVFCQERLAAMEPNDFIKALKDLASIQRDALGLNHKGKGDESAPPIGASMEVTLRSVAKTSGATDNDGKTTANTNILDLLNDPVKAEAAQELVFKLHMGNRESEKAFVADKSSAQDERDDLAMITGDNT